MKREISKFENTCDSLISGIFETILLPKIRKAAIKIGVESIEEMNNYYFFEVHGKKLIEREFCKLGAKYQSFYNTYISPIGNSRYQYPFNFKFSMYQ